MGDKPISPLFVTFDLEGQQICLSSFDKAMIITRKTCDDATQILSSTIIAHICPLHTSQQNTQTPHTLCYSVKCACDAMVALLWSSCWLNHRKAAAADLVDGLSHPPPTQTLFIFNLMIDSRGWGVAVSTFLSPYISNACYV